MYSRRPAAARPATPAELKLAAERRRRVQRNLLTSLGKAIGANRTLFGKKVVTLQQAFQAIDRNHDGTLSHAEFRAAMRRPAGPPPSPPPS